MEKKHSWKKYVAGGMTQAAFTCGEDIARLAELDRKQWLAISMPVKGIRFDARMLELMDTDHDGRIRADEVLGAIDFLKSKNVDFDDLFKPSEADSEALGEILAKEADLAAREPTEDEKKALAEWEAKGSSPEIAVAGDGTAEANAALAAVEGVIDAWFAPADDMPLVTDEPDKVLPLRDHLNPRHLKSMIDFAEKCVRPVLGDRETLTRIEYGKVKAAFEPYREYLAAKPKAGAFDLAALEDEERVLRYRLHLLEFLENYVNMKRLYEEDSLSIFQTGILRIDAKELNLCLHVDSEAAHSALADKSLCCVIYLKLSRPSEGAERQICAVVTAGTVAGLYVGRNGVFYDRDGKDWEAVVTKVVESQVSLVEAFWAPWKKLGSAIGGMVKKFFGDRQAAVDGSVSGGKLPPASSGGGAAMASSVAAIGIGVGIMGAAMASILSAVKGMGPGQIALAIVAIIAIVSLPSVILTWFKLRRRDIGAILNASGWAINRPMRFSMARARGFTKCRMSSVAKFLMWAVVILVLVIAAHVVCCAARGGCCRSKRAAANPPPAEQCAPAAEPDVSAE